MVDWRHVLPSKGAWNVPDTLGECVLLDQFDVTWNKNSVLGSDAWVKNKELICQWLSGEGEIEKRRKLDWVHQRWQVKANFRSN